MSGKKFLIWILVFFFCGLGFAYNIMGFGKSVDIEEGQGGLHRSDRNQSIDMAKFILDGDFGFYSRETMKVAMISEPGGRYNYPPVPGLIEAPVVLFSRLTGMDDVALFDISILPFILLSGLAVVLICNVFEKYAAEELTDGGVILISIFLFSGLLLYSVVKEGKFEGIIAFFGLLGILFLPKRKLISGICFGLAICTKQIAVLLVIPTFFILLQEKQYKELIKWAAAVTITALIIMTPFLLGSGLERVHLSLSKNMDLFKIQATSTMGYLYRITTFITGGENKTFEKFLQFYANKFVLLICILASFLFSLRRKITTSTPERFFALLVFCSFIFIILGKYYTSGIYEIAPTYFLVLWAIASRETVFGAIVLLLQSFLCSHWPLALYRDQLLLILYFVTVVFVWRISLAGDKKNLVSATE